MHPRKLVDFIKEDITGTMGLCEDLFGIRVQPGETPIDLLIAHIDKAYLDFSPEDQRFKQAAIKIFGKYPDPAEWYQLIAQSSQSNMLKEKLIAAVGATQGAASQQAQTGKYIIKTRRGKTIVADLIKKVTGPNGGEFYYIGIEPTKIRIKSWSNKPNRDKVPEFYERITKKVVSRTGRTTMVPLRTRWIQKFQTILTINPQNIVSIDRQ